MDFGLLSQLALVTEEEQLLLDGGPVDTGLYSSGQGFVVDSAKMLEQDELISIRPHTRFADFPEHSHNFVEIMYMCGGETRHLVGGRSLTLRTGELLFMNQHARHAIARARQQDIAVNFMVSPRFFDQVLPMVGADNALGRFLLDGLRQKSGDLSFLHFQVADVLPVQNLVENLIWSLVSHQPNGRRLLPVTMGLLFLQLLTCTDQMAAGGGSPGGSGLVIRALRMIEESYDCASLSELAAQHGVSTAYLSRLVHEACGKSFKELLQEKRLERAAYLLRESRLSVGDILASVGYDNSSYFYRIFRERFGVSPACFRQVK